MFRFLENKMWIDELYERTVIALQPDGRASVRLDGSLFLGRLGARIRRFGQFFGVFTAGFDERGINAGVDESDRPARAAWAE